MARLARSCDHALASITPTGRAGCGGDDNCLPFIRHQLWQLDLRLVRRGLYRSETHNSVAAFFGASDLLWRAKVEVCVLSLSGNFCFLYVVSDVDRASGRVSFLESGARMISSALLAQLTLQR